MIFLSSSTNPNNGHFHDIPGTVASQFQHFCNEILHSGGEENRGVNSNLSKDPSHPHI